MHQGLIRVACFGALLFAGAALPQDFDSLAPERDVPSLSRDSAGDSSSRATSRLSTAVRDSGSAARISKAVAKRDTAPLVLSHGDSTLHAVLSTIAHDDSLSIAPRSNSVSAQARDAEPRERSRAARLFSASLSWIARSWFLLAAVLAVGVLGSVAWGISAHRRAKKESRRFMTTMRLSLMDPEVQRACLHIEKSYVDPLLSPALVCGAIVTGEPFLAALFERELGMTITDYIDLVRIHHAKRIATLDPTISEDAVALRTGFTDAYTFTSRFKTLTGAIFETYCKEKRMYS